MTEEIEEYYEEEEEEEESLSLEEKYKEQFEKESEYYYKYKQLEAMEVREKLSNLSYGELVEREARRKERELLETEPVGSMTLVYNKNFGSFKPCKVLDDNKLETNIAGENKTITILHEPINITIEMRKYWIAGGIFWRLRYSIVWFWMWITGMMTLGTIRFNCFFVRSDGEYTIDPSLDWTPWELQRRLEAFLKLEGRLLKANIKGQLLSDQRDKDPFIKVTYAFIIAIVILQIANLWVIGSGI